MLILKVACGVVGPETKVHCINHESVGENLFDRIGIRVDMIFCPRLKAETFGRYFLF